MCQRNKGRRLEINQAIRHLMPTSSKDRTDYFNFVSVIQDRSKLLRHDSCRFVDGCDSLECVLKRLVAVFNLRMHSVRQIFDWKPNPNGSTHLQYCDLLRHLFTRYDVPQWILKSHSTIDLLALIHIGAGGSLRTAWPNIKLSKSMARALWLVPAGLQRAEAFTWAQIKTLGGSDSLAKTLCHGDRLLHFAPDFRTTIMRFFVRCERDAATPLLMSEIPSAIQFIQNIKLLPARAMLGLRVTHDAGPLCPDLSLEGRNLRWLRRKMANWKEEIVATIDTEMLSKSLDWHPCEVDGLNFVSQDFQWKIFELCSSWRLKYEGTKMRHCVASYVNKCSSGRAAIWTVRRTDLKTNATSSMATIEVNPHTRTVVQISAKYNARPSDATMQVIRRWADWVNLSFAEAL